MSCKCLKPNPRCFENLNLDCLSFSKCIKVITHIHALCGATKIQWYVAHWCWFLSMQKQLCWYYWRQRASDPEVKYPIETSIHIFIGIALFLEHAGNQTFVMDVKYIKRKDGKQRNVSFIINHKIIGDEVFSSLFGWYVACFFFIFFLFGFFFIIRFVLVSLRACTRWCEEIF